MCRSPFRPHQQFQDVGTLMDDAETTEVEDEEDSMKVIKAKELARREAALVLLEFSCGGAQGHNSDARDSTRLDGVAEVWEGAHNLMKLHQTSMQVHCAHEASATLITRSQFNAVDADDTDVDDDPWSPHEECEAAISTICNRASHTTISLKPDAGPSSTRQVPPSPSSEEMDVAVTGADDVAPSANNHFKFQQCSSSGLTAIDLERLFRPPARPKKFPMEVASEYLHPPSYRQIGTMPQAGLAAQLVRQMEAHHKKDVKKWEIKYDATADAAREDDAIEG